MRHFRRQENFSYNFTVDIELAALAIILWRLLHLWNTFQIKAFLITEHLLIEQDHPYLV